MADIERYYSRRSTRHRAAAPAHVRPRSRRSPAFHVGLGAAQPRGRRRPPFWVVREGPTVIAAWPLTPVRVSGARLGSARRMERRTAGRGRAAAAGTRRIAAPRLGSRRRRRARRWPFGSHPAAARRAALAAAGAADLPGQAAQPSRASYPDLAGSRSTAWCRRSRCRWSGSWRALQPLTKR